MLRVCEVVLEIWVGHIIAQDMFRPDVDGPMLTFLKQRLLDALVLFIPLQLLVHCGTAWGEAVYQEFDGCGDEVMGA